MNKSRQKIISAILIVAGLSSMMFIILFGICDCDTSKNTSAETTEVTTEFESIVFDTETEPQKEPSVETVAETTIETETETETETACETTETPVVQYYDVPLEESLQDHIFNLCETYNIDPTIVLAIIYRESTYRPYVIGDNGHAFGLMQIQPKWHQGRMDKLGVTDLMDPYQNVSVGIDYLGELSAGKSIEWTLMAYNGGPDYADYKASQGAVTAYATEVIAHSKTLTTKS